MKRTLFSLTLLSFLSCGSLYCENAAETDHMEQLSLQEDNIDLESDLQDDISALEREILNSEETTETAMETKNEALELSTKVSTLQDSASTPLFSSLEEASPISLANNEVEETSLGVDIQTMPDPFMEESSITDEITANADKGGIEINLVTVFEASPLIYSLLLSLSLSAIAIWLYSMSRLKYQGSISQTLKVELQNKLQERQFSEALTLCKDKQSLLTQMLSSGLSTQKHGFQTMIDNMKAEGKRATVSSWQRLGLLQDIAIIAPMLGLLGTVLGMFYAFYDLNRSLESVASLFDGFGIAVGTTVAGIAVAILAMLLHSIIKFRLVQSLARVENEATALVRIMDENNSL